MKLCNEIFITKREDGERGEIYTIDLGAEIGIYQVEISQDEHVEYGAKFGELEGHPNLKNKTVTHPKIFELAASSGGIADEWHTDITFQDSPAIMSVLHMVKCPELGGDTMWSNLNAAYEALSDPKWAGKLCLRTSKKVYNRSLMASMIDAYGYDEAKAVVLGWVSNLATEVFSNDTNALKAVSSGQCGVTIVNTYYLARLLDDPKYDNLSLFWANQGDRGVHVNISGAGVVKTSKNKANAVKLLEYLSSMKAQDFYASANKEYPVLASADIDDSIEGRGEFSEDNINVSKLGSLQKEAVFLAQEAGYK